MNFQVHAVVEAEGRVGKVAWANVHLESLRLYNTKGDLQTRTSYIPPGFPAMVEV